MTYFDTVKVPFWVNEPLKGHRTYLFREVKGPGESAFAMPWRILKGHAPVQFKHVFVGIAWAASTKHDYYFAKVARLEIMVNRRILLDVPLDGTRSSFDFPQLITDADDVQASVYYPDGAELVPPPAGYLTVRVDLSEE